MNRENISILSHSELLAEIKLVRSREREAIADMVLYLAEVDSRKLYRNGGCTSLFTYCREVLLYSESGAYRRSQAARVLNECPEIYEKLKNGELSLCAVAEIARVKEEEKRVLLLESASGKGKAEVQKMVAAVLPPTRAQKPTIKVKSVTSSAPLFTQPQQEERYVVRMEVDKEFMALYEQAKELSGSATSIQEVLRKSLKEYVANHQPRLMKNLTRNPRTRTVALSLRNQVLLRDSGQCTFQSDDGKRCSCRTGLELDHITPYASGGETILSNLRLRCRAHNQLEAEKWFGSQFMALKRKSPSAVEVKV